MNCSENTWVFSSSGRGGGVLYFCWIEWLKEEIIGNDMEKQNHRIMVRIITTWRRLKEPSRMKESTNKLFWVMHSFLLGWRAGLFRANQTGQIVIQVCWGRQEFILLILVYKVSTMNRLKLWHNRKPSEAFVFLQGAAETTQMNRKQWRSKSLCGCNAKKITPCHANNNLRARA